VKSFIYILLIVCFNIQNNYSQWILQTSGVTGYLWSVFFVDTSEGFCVGENGTILKTTDGGTIWNSMYCPINENLLDIFFVDSSIGYIVGNSGTILKTTNGGESWNAQTSGYNA